MYGIFKLVECVVVRRYVACVENPANLQVRLSSWQGFDHIEDDDDSLSVLCNPS